MFMHRLMFSFRLHEALPLGNIGESDLRHGNSQPLVVLGSLRSELPVGFASSNRTLFWGGGGGRGAVVESVQSDQIAPRMREHAQVKRSSTSLLFDQFIDRLEYKQIHTHARFKPQPNEPGHYVPSQLQSHFQRFFCGNLRLTAPYVVGKYGTVLYVVALRLRELVARIPCSTHTFFRCQL